MFAKQNRTITEQFDFFEEGAGGRSWQAGEPHFKIVISIIIGTRKKMFCRKFKQNRTINE